MRNIIRHQSDARLSRAVIHNGVVYLAGITADNRGGTSKTQTEEILAKIDALLKLAGSSNNPADGGCLDKLRPRPDNAQYFSAWHGFSRHCVLDH